MAYEVQMPKWGLTMKTGKIARWLVAEGGAVAVGQPLLEVETDKITNVVEAGETGVLRRVLGEPGTVYPVKALIAVLAEPDVPDDDIDAFINAYAVPACEDDGDADSGPQYHTAETEKYD